MKKNNQTCGRSIVHFLGASVFAVFFLAPMARAGDKVTFDLERAEEEKFTLDVACDARTSNLNRVDPSATTQARGDAGIVNGFIYEGGVLPFDDFNGSFNPDTSPAPKLGTWVCLNTRGALPAPRNSAVTYYFGLPDFETAGIITQGFNSHRRKDATPPTIPVVHAIVGGTGKYLGATGEVLEEVIGVNSTGATGFNLRYHFTIKKQAFKKDKSQR
ncbi:MAG: hypothetical protein HOP18_20070 [Deltaproteobacteria bacterium]|nr:hypothetical protein [Deltaproteobacteria bacterium]